MTKTASTENMFLHVEEKRGIRELSKKTSCSESYNIKSIALLLKPTHGMRKLGSSGCVLFCKNENTIVSATSCGFLLKLSLISLTSTGDFPPGLSCSFSKFSITRSFLIITSTLPCHTFRFPARKNVKYKHAMRLH